MKDDTLEADRIIPDNFGLTEMGRDLLAQDYLLKQIASSLSNPDTDLGKKFWDGVYAKAFNQFGTTDIPTDTFNKVWVTPDTAEVYECWTELVTKYEVLGRQVHDAYHVAAMMVHRVPKVLTLDRRDFSRYEGIEVVFPEEI